MQIGQKLEQVLNRFYEIGQTLAKGVDDSKEFVRLSKEYENNLPIGATHFHHRLRQR